ncbi:molybdenum cofactor biosynthesis protein MoaE [Rathayibacter sp. ZW T2_19]|jgi:molybdopterin synthase catalytic subunit|uniref:Molybdenum cofactor biosynthesis protein MoaE n=1 Tax=Rathayibacter rubneri TaxID=2950106 RepID=A0A9X2DZK1_9MICO|nr:molybdenum cofactor biosynthesis protein MoaE [Rathayibacter rubneri]MCM6762633.1 molybdenum cofactor biosynthesis protein MoaE [Rathayibacter rubneri]
MSADPVALVRIASEPITVDECEDAVDSPAHGAVVTFAGVVRDHDEGRGVVRLAYEAHPDASAALAASARRIVERFPEVRVAAVHRVGDLVVGDLALACAVASPHRAAAFEACAALVDDIKASVPIWKEQSFVDGTSEWVASLG